MFKGYNLHNWDDKKIYDKDMWGLFYKILNPVSFIGTPAKNFALEAKFRILIFLPILFQRSRFRSSCANFFVPVVPVVRLSFEQKFN